MKQAIDTDPSIKLIFLCSPGNPTGTLIPLSAVRELLEYQSFKGIVVVDEAYIDFSGEDASAASLVKGYANVCVMQTLSKSFGLAAIRYASSPELCPSRTHALSHRLGIALAHPALIQILMNTKAPYNISTPTAAFALAALAPEAVESMRQKVRSLVAGRTWLLEALSALPPGNLGRAIGGNDANFIVVPVLEKNGSGAPDSARAQRIYKVLAEEEGVVVRFRGNEPGCLGCLRITIGTSQENETVVTKLKELLQKL
jgi:histidinol-phosphate aminotransferase